MAEYTDADVTRLATKIGGDGMPGPSARYAIARSLLDWGVTLPDPPPDPAVVVAEWIWPLPTLAEFIAAVRDMFPPEALAAAAAKVQEADRG